MISGNTCTEKVTVEHSAPPGESLAKGQTKQEIHSAASDGNAAVTVKGLTADSIPLTIQNEDLTVKVEAGFEPGTPTSSAGHMYNRYAEVSESGIIPKAATRKAERSQIVSLIGGISERLGEWFK